MPVLDKSKVWALKALCVTTVYNDIPRLFRYVCGELPTSSLCL